MIRLHLSGPTEPPVTLGPAPWFRVAGNFIRQGPHGNIVGTFRRHNWEVESRQYGRIECREPVLVHFEDAAGGPTEDFGPFADFLCLDGALHAGGEVFAKFMEETQLWHCLPTETYWPVLVVKAPPAGP
jgi:hypothetical protein